jgi:hypothetical protein
MAFDGRDIFAGLSGAQLPVETFDLGEGVTLSRTFAHLMAPYLMAFSPPEPGKPHPAPWRAVSGGVGFDILVQLNIPSNFDTTDWFDGLNSVWWFVALLRFRAAHTVVCPVVSDTAFADAANCGHEPKFIPIEADPWRLQLAVKPSILLEHDLEWIRDRWRTAGELMRANEQFSTLFQAFDQSLFVRNPALALLLLWGALETVFSPARSELRFRVSANIASYLEPRGPQRLELQKHVAKLYDARSSAAHTSSSNDDDALQQTYALAGRVLHRMVERGHVPTREELEEGLFGGGA